MFVTFLASQVHVEFNNCIHTENNGIFVATTFTVELKQKRNISKYGFLQRTITSINKLISHCLSKLFLRNP